MIRIKSDKIIVGESLFDGYVYVENGKISEVTKQEKNVMQELEQKFQELLLAHV